MKNRFDVKRARERERTLLAKGAHEIDNFK